MEDAGFDLLPGEHPIVPIMLGDAALATRMANLMLEVCSANERLPTEEPIGVIPLFGFIQIQPLAPAALGVHAS